MKMKGAEWKEFYNDSTVWEERHAWHDDLIIIVDGKEIDDDFYEVDPKSTVIIKSGTIFLNGDPNDRNAQGLKIESEIRKWRRSRKFKTICVEVPNEMFFSVCQRLKEDGCKVIK